MRKLPFDKDEPDDDDSKFAWFYSSYGDDDDDDFDIDIDQEVDRMVEERIKDITSEFMMEVISREQERYDHLSQESLKSAINFVNGSFWAKFLPSRFRIGLLMDTFNAIMQEVSQYEKEPDVEVEVQKIEHIDESVKNDKE